MKITQLLTPMNEVRWLSTTDTVGEAFGRGASAAPTGVPALGGRRRAHELKRPEEAVCR